MTSQSTKNSILTLSAPAPVIAAGGAQFYEIDASSVAVAVKLPAPVAGAAVTFFAIDTTNPVTISATTAGTINGNARHVDRVDAKALHPGLHDADNTLNFLAHCVQRRFANSDDVLALKVAMRQFSAASDDKRPLPRR